MIDVFGHQVVVVAAHVEVVEAATGIIPTEGDTSAVTFEPGNLCLVDKIDEIGILSHTSVRARHNIGDNIIGRLVLTRAKLAVIHRG